MPASASTRLATRPSLTERMRGIPPATAASKASVTERRRASSYSSAPWWASSALLAVTTCLPAASARRMKVRAGSSPPTSSTTTWMDGSSSTRAASPTMGSARRSRPSRGRVRSVSAMAARLSRAPARSWSISERVWRIFTTPAPTVPSPSRPMRTSFTGSGSATQRLEAPERLPDPLLVLDEGEADVPLSVLAEADAGRDRDSGLLDEQLAELQRAELPERVGDGRPHEHRALRLGHRPADLVETIDQDVAPLAVDLDDLGHALLVVLQRHDAGDLDGLKGAVVQVGLDPAQRAHHPGVAAHEAEPPAGHVVRLGGREDLHAHVLGPRHLQEGGRPVAVEREV